MSNSIVGGVILCPDCGRVQCRTIEESYTGGSHKVYRCTSCGFRAEEDTSGGDALMLRANRPLDVLLVLQQSEQVAEPVWELKPMSRVAAEVIKGALDVHYPEDFVLLLCLVTDQGFTVLLNQSDEDELNSYGLFEKMDEATQYWHTLNSVIVL